MFAHCAACAVATGHVGGADLACHAVRGFEGGGDGINLLLELQQFGIPLHAYTLIEQVFAHDAFVVILAEDQHVRERALVLTDVAERNTPGPAAFGP